MPKPKTKKASSPKTEAVAKADKELAEAETAVKDTQAKVEGKPDKSGEGEQTKSPSSSQPEDKPDFGERYAELAEKKGFESPEDLASAYTNLEKRASRVENMAREALRRTDQAKQEKPDAGLSDEEAQAIELLKDTIRDVVRDEFRPIRAEADRKFVEDEIASVQEKYPWFKGKVVDDAVAMMARGEATSLEAAAKILTYDIATEEARKATAKEEKTAEKKSAYAESAGGAASSKEVDYDSMTLEELEEVLPKRGDFVDSKGRLRRG